MSKKKLLDELEIAMEHCSAIGDILFPLKETYNTAYAQFDNLFHEAMERGYTDEIDKLFEKSYKRWRNSNVLV